MASTLELAERWLSLDCDDATRKEIQGLVDINDEAELEKRLRNRIAFGTAGLRSSMKAGFAHMNSLTVLQASHGLANYILASTSQSSGTSAKPSVVLGYDARHNSEKFARLAAAAFLSKGVQVFWFGRLVHTPMVPFAISKYHATAGVMVTASHNPKQDNGYKVYWSNGSQIIPPRDADIAKAIDAVDVVETWDPAVVESHPKVDWIFDEATSAYHQSVLTIAESLSSKKITVPFVYTPMHGVGLPMMRRVAHDMIAFDHMLHVVPTQADPDPEFPTVPFPNPEEKGALDLAIKEAEDNGLSLVLASDPDADRFSAAVKIDGGKWHQFTGNQIGVLLASHVLESYKGNRNNLVMLASTVSSRMLASMAKKVGFEFRETLTGFKWLGNVAQDLEREGKDAAFAYEEAIGYMFPSVVWDKDGIAAAVAFLSACQSWKEQGLTPYQKLQALYKAYGHFEDANTYLKTPSPAVTNKVFAGIRISNNGKIPEKIGSRKIMRWRDLTTGYDSATADNRPDLPIDASAQMITCDLGDVVFTTRGSGTEPKIKLYIEGKASSSEEAQRIADEVLNDLIKEWFKPEYGLKLAGT